MKLSRPFIRLPSSLSLLVTALTLQATAAPVTSTVLTPQTFKETISKGVWFIEHFSPYCGHCRKFEPTWMKLVEEFEKPGGPKIHLAQVNCALNGDLCSENGVTGYPQMNLYQDGKYQETFKDSRDFDILLDYLVAHAGHTDVPPPTSSAAPEAAPTPTLPTEPLHVQISRAEANPSGDVVSLSEKSFPDFIGRGPAFVKFFAPWCGHCKKLAPVWKQLGRHMKGKLNIAEVNCDEQKSLCSSQGVTGYPMLFYYAHGAKSEYTGTRKYDQLVAFTEKASSPTMEVIEAGELEKRASENSVLYLLLHSAHDTQTVDKVAQDSQVLFGSPPVFVSTSQELFERYGVRSSWTILAFKDNDVKEPTSVYRPSATDASDTLSAWLTANRNPTSLELSRDVFQQVMNAPHKPLVVIAAVTGDTKEQVAEKLNDIGKKWRVRQGQAGQRDVVFTWMDRDQWGSWMKSMYGIKATTEPAVVVTDHSRLLYYDKDSNGQSIQLTSVSVFSAIEGALSGTIRPKHSENFMERLVRYFNSRLVAFEEFVVEHPYFIAFLGLGFLTVMFVVLKRAMSDELGDLQTDRRHGKSSRLD
ncbi:thioredoxin-like protein [Leucogyrophana mollusca]|uniref:Thioredoxin-like protein n=1 Tax=Leucogyrophana mollusca TaxID=85980 RepID=A0ACB8BYI2_9AGAM|nr:thioredoxin-like protein [Leucogyrophana mollusca]